MNSLPELSKVHDFLVSLELFHNKFLMPEKFYKNHMLHYKRSTNWKIGNLYKKYIQNICNNS
jgi:hypothetical protein